MQQLEDNREDLVHALLVPDVFVLARVDDEDAHQHRLDRGLAKKLVVALRSVQVLANLALERCIHRGLTELLRDIVREEVRMETAAELSVVVALRRDLVGPLRRRDVRRDRAEEELPHNAPHE